ncbi:dienelactone hydrolase family protein [Parvibaculaceae bacterium PLY_AMNH_Bact1]|nr:dienelactone hydrolase family protein [Parvibaculaceae bacterium PLY_AMNH_Bact1]
MARSGNTIELVADQDFDLGAYLVTPADVDAEPNGQGLVLIQEIFGVTDHIKELCDGYAERGFTVIAPSMCDRGEKGWQSDYTGEGFQRSIELAQNFGGPNAQGDIQAAIDFLKAQGTDIVHITGYCYGGSMAWLAACRCTGLASAVGYYGRLIMDMEDETPSVPTMLHFGDKDASIPIDWVRAFKDKRTDITVHIYEADHGFNSDRRDHYSKEAADLAFTRTLEWFAKAS